MWFQVRPVDISFTQRSPFQFHNETVIRAPPDRVFSILATGENQTEWFKDFVSNRWTSDPPSGVGATRDVELKTVMVKERFLVWDPGKRLSFCFYGITLPLIKEMLEDIQFEPDGQGGTRFTWTAHYTPTLLTRLVHPIVRSVFGGLFKETTERLKRYAEKTA